MDALARAGFDIAHPFDAAAWFPGEPRRGLLVGNTRALWPVFREALRDPALAAEPDPLDRYTEHAIDAAFPGARIYYGHRTYAGAFVPLQRIAVAAGLGALSPSQLVIHPIYGPWFALRAVVLRPGEPTVTPPVARACHCDGRCEAAFAAALTATSWPPWLAVRDACTLRAWRYSDEQIAYHYGRLRLPG